jgi:hypothetical protein
MKIKTAAERKPPEENLKNFSSLITEQMARSAVLLAQLWDQMYKEAGEPELKSYKSYRYPLTPEFVTPDYYTIETKTSNSN